jgi:predicted site-specific integrase-resolvase
MSQEILTSDEITQRLKISRSTLFEWIRKEVLISGSHYLKEGRIPLCQYS